ncbi:MAG: SRPBCC family protein [Chloroflexota bacterium]|nr:SRPBCC family protein [Chloroflexota bacterium]
MQTLNQIVMRADPDVVFRLAGEVEYWPAILPHYRSVRVLRRRGQKRLVHMAATRDGFPVSWTSIQWLDPAARRIWFRHVKGVSRGMDVEWRIEPRDDDSVEVTIEHWLALDWPVIGGFAAERIIGPLFVENIAGKTLRRIKEIAEGGSLEGRR